jgi:hypothetical protein
MNNLINRNIHRDIITWDEEGGSNTYTEIEPKENKTWWEKLLHFFGWKSH